MAKLSNSFSEPAISGLTCSISKCNWKGCKLERYTEVWDISLHTLAEKKILLSLLCERWQNVYFAKHKKMLCISVVPLSYYCLENILLRLYLWLCSIQQGREGFGPSDVWDYNSHHALLYGVCISDHLRDENQTHPAGCKAALSLIYGSWARNYTQRHYVSS